MTFNPNVTGPTPVRARLGLGPCCVRRFQVRTAPIRPVANTPTARATMEINWRLFSVIPSP